MLDKPNRKASPKHLITEKKFDKLIGIVKDLSYCTSTRSLQEMISDYYVFTTHFNEELNLHNKKPYNYDWYSSL